MWSGAVSGGMMWSGMGWVWDDMEWCGVVWDNVEWCGVMR